jgi:hypothetical protein
MENAAAATTLAPKNARFATTEALTSVFADETKQALALLDRAKTLRGNWIDRDWFVLAIAQHRSGQQRQAQESMARGLTWMEDQQPFNAHLRLLRETAEAFLEE